MIGNLGLLIALLALLSSALFSTLHLALRSVVRTRLSDMAEDTGSPAAQKRVQRILEDVEGHCLAIGLPRIISTLIVPVALVFWIAGPAVVAEGAAQPAPTTAHVTLALIASAVFLWLFGFVVPSSLATHVGEGLILRLSLLIRAIYVLLRPFDRVAQFVDEIVRRLARVDDETDAEVLEAELLSVVEEGRQEGQFDETEQDMIEAVVEFRSTTVEEIMTPRTEIEAMQHTDDLDAVKAFVRDCPHSRIPVYNDNLDHVSGVLYAKDLLRWLTAEKPPAPFTLQQLLRPAVFVPETKTVRQLMHELLAQKVHIAMVIDEYGGTAGLVTIEDIVEEIFGEIQDEYEGADEASPELTIDTETREATIDARMHIDDANDALEALDFEIPESEDYDTVAGFVTVTLGRIPEAGESFASANLSVHVLEAEPTRVVRVRVGPTPEPPPEQDEPADRAVAE
ncbi:MAG: HlyC/CorC family transporter [Phycisphaerales bacterium]|nr:HlyC/CorC family transporter [Phycisphaerales bacterium]